jgi:hypothetical protein
MSDKEAFNALLRTDPHVFLERVVRELEPGAKFVDGWHLHAIIHQLVRCYNGEITRLLIIVPPRHLKSITTSVAFPAWVLGQDPTRRIICASYANELALPLSMKTRTIMSTPWYQQAFPGTRLQPAPNTQAAFSTTQNGGRQAFTVGGPLTGLGGNFIIIDDPHKADDVLSDAKRESVIHWYQNTLLTRLDNKDTDVIIVIMQRLHENDLAGFLMQMSDWEVAQ